MLIRSFFQEHTFIPRPGFSGEAVRNGANEMSAENDMNGIIDCMQLVLQKSQRSKWLLKIPDAPNGKTRLLVIIAPV